MARGKALPGTLRRATTAGAHHLTFRARLRRGPLRAGRYRLVLRATDAAGNRSAPKRLAFTWSRAGSPQMLRGNGDANESIRMLAELWWRAVSSRPGAAAPA